MANDSQGPARKIHRQAYMRNAQPAKERAPQEEPSLTREEKKRLAAAAQREQLKEQRRAAQGSTDRARAAKEQSTTRRPSAHQQQNAQQRTEHPRTQSAPKQQAAHGQATRGAQPTTAQPPRKAQNTRKATEKAAKQAKQPKYAENAAPRPRGKNAAPKNTGRHHGFEIPDTPDTEPRARAKRGARGKARERTLTKEAVRAQARMRAIIKAVCLLLIVVVGVVMSVVLVFTIDEVEVKAFDGGAVDTGVYTQELIIEQLNLTLGDNIFSFSTREKEAELKAALPLLESIDVRREYPNKVNIYVTPAVETYTIASDSGWLVLSENLMVIREASEQPALPLLSGASPDTWQIGQTLALQTQTSALSLADDVIEEGEEIEESDETEEASSEERIADLLVLLTALQDVDLLADITELIFESDSGISFLYQDRVAVLIGTTNNLDYKLSFVSYILKNEKGDGIAATDTGVLDASYQKIDGTIEPVFSQGEAILPRDSDASEGDTDNASEDAAADAAGDNASEGDTDNASEDATDNALDGDASLGDSAESTDITDTADTGEGSST